MWNFQLGRHSIVPIRLFDGVFGQLHETINSHTEINLIYIRINSMSTFPQFFTFSLPRWKKKFSKNRVRKTEKPPNRQMPNAFCIFDKSIFNAPFHKYQKFNSNLNHRPRMFCILAIFDWYCASVCCIIQ